MFNDKTTPSAGWTGVCLLFMLTAFAAPASAQIDRVEPPFWWAGMKHSELQVMVHGERVAELAPTLDCAGVRLAAATRLASPNYLFLTLRLAADLQPGECTITFRRADGTSYRHAYAFKERRPGSAERQGFTAADVLYLITPDRFANGDPSNDVVAGMREGIDRSEPYGRHGGDLQGVIDHLDYIADMGFTQVWFNPVLENDQPAASYHGYSTTDYYRVDPRFGSNDLYRELSRLARQRGLGLIMDLIPNHIGDEHWWMDDRPSPDWINHGTFVQTSHVRRPLHDPHAAPGEVGDFADGWFVETMPDLNQRQPQLATYLIQNAIWWVEFADLSGIRVDTWSYADKDFLSHWTRRLMAEYPNFNIVGEEWIETPAVIAYWQRGQQRRDGYRSDLPSLMDFPLNRALARALNEDESRTTGIVGLYRSLANDFLYPDPGNLLVFADNHDMSRIFTQVDEDEDLFRLAMVFVLTTRGIPQIFYGTEILMSNKGTGSHGVIRSDFPGGWPGDAANGFTGEGLSAAAVEAQRFLRNLLRWRRGAPAVTGGSLTHYAPRNGVYVYFRTAPSQRLMVAINKNEASISLDLERFRPLLGDADSAVDPLTGTDQSLAGTLELPARGFLVLEF